MGWPWSRKSSKNHAPSQQDLDNDHNEQLAKVISTCEEHYRKKREEEEENELNEAIKESLKLTVIDQDNTTSQSLDLYHNKTSLQDSHSNAPLQDSFESISTSDLVVNHHHPSICDCCDSVIEENGRFVNVMGVVWHPECFCCLYCYKPIKKHYVSNLRGNFHRSCYHRYCYVCGDKFARGRSLNHHEFWNEMYCPDHKTDGTPKCFSCERLEPKGTNYVMLDDERRICVECMECAVMSTDECIALHIEIREFFETLNMKICKEFSVFLVEKQALNRAEKKENINNEEGVVTRGICLSEEQTVKIVCKRPRRGPNNQLIDIATEYQRLVRKCEVTAILILYGLPRLLTGAILAHEMMHAWLRLNGYKNLRAEVEEGLCQVLGHMWLESQTYSSTDAAIGIASSSTTSSSYSSTSKKGDPSEFERKFVDFCKNQIETDESKDYGDGFREVSKLVSKYGLEKVLAQIKQQGSRKF